MITAQEMREKANKVYTGPTIQTKARRIALEHAINKAAANGYFSIEVSFLDDINIEYFKMQGFKIEWENSCFLLAAGHWRISWRNEND